MFIQLTASKAFKISTKWYTYGGANVQTDFWPFNNSNSYVRLVIQGQHLTLHNEKYLQCPFIIIIFLNAFCAESTPTYLSLIWFTPQSKIHEKIVPMRATIFKFNFNRYIFQLFHLWIPQCNKPFTIANRRSITNPITTTKTHFLITRKILDTFQKFSLSTNGEVASCLLCTHGNSKHSESCNIRKLNI